MTPSDVVAARVRQVRTSRGLTVPQLAERCAAVGAPQLSVQAIYKIEGQRESATRSPRRVTVDELLALALALDVAPVHLVIPFGDDEPCALTAGVTEPAAEARPWFTGQNALKGTNRVAYYSFVPEREAERMRRIAEMVDVGELYEIEPGLFTKVWKREGE